MLQDRQEKLPRRRSRWRRLAATLAAARLGGEPLPEGDAGGQCKQPRGLAVDESSGRTYVADRGNDRVDVFDEAGAFLFSFGEGVLRAPDLGRGRQRPAQPLLPRRLRGRLRPPADRPLRRRRAAADGDRRRRIRRQLGARTHRRDAGRDLLGLRTALRGRRSVARRSTRAANASSGKAAGRRRSASPPACAATRPAAGRRSSNADIVAVPRNFVAGGNLKGLAVDSAGDLYVRNVRDAGKALQVRRRRSEGSRATAKRAAFRQRKPKA